MKQGQSALVRLVSTALSVCLAVSLAYLGYGYWALVGQELARSLFFMVGIWSACPWRPGLPKRDKEVRSLVRFGTDLTVAQLVYAVISNVDRLLVGKLFGAGTLGVYRQAQQLMMVPIEQLNAPIGGVAQSGLSRLQSFPQRYQRYYRKVVYMVALATMPTAAFGALYADEIVKVMLGTAWVEATPFLRIFALAAFIRPALGTAGIVLISSGRSRRLLIITLVSQVILLIFLVLGLKWGALGVAMAYLLTATALLLPNLHFSFSGTPVNLSTFFQGVRSPALASAMMVAGLILFRAMGVERVNAAALILSIGLGGILYFGSLAILPGGRGELVEVISDVAGSLPVHRLSPTLSVKLTRITNGGANTSEG